MPFLDWVNKAQAVEAASRVPHHLLEFQSAHGEGGAENLLIQGDNLAALKALVPSHRGQVRCICIDPPYNTQSGFELYDDKLEHAQWLSMMYPRLVLLRELLREDGSLWVTLDDNEAHYAKVLMDEVFGRENFVTSICWEKVYTLKNTAKNFSEMHDFVLVYARSQASWAANLLPRGEKQNRAFKNPDADPRGPWIDSAVHARNFYSKGSYSVVGPTGKSFSPPPGRYWTVSEENFRALDAEKRIWWGADGKNAPRKKTFLTEVKAGVVPGTIWSHEEAGHNAEAKAEIKALFGRDEEIFITPKPERLIERILHIATEPGDLVLDSFLGSGTTAAVAHKMGRRWIGVELGEHARTHCLPRLEKVVAGEQGGISESVGWKGGGGFRFYTLGERVTAPDRSSASDVSSARGSKPR
ncbi:site-specific DNA-methyltransferase [Hyalangium rubrum]|uniref:site-specific DNA-methyltransferase (adenine-specific) n=1 Tax=Hyalangium rubrum TaxID=3103134 RepID=A0ABU5GXG1_9BACT|nr:site-specific DNA-methyltransferase [Hyalangium sp. s54d21]MDY7225776.1 site-specific DNA-methyltransferase [Hyalangium sp. s54d21]